MTEIPSKLKFTVHQNMEMAASISNKNSQEPSHSYQLFKKKLRRNKIIRFGLLVYEEWAISFGQFSGIQLTGVRYSYLLSMKSFINPFIVAGHLVVSNLLSRQDKCFVIF